MFVHAIWMLESKVFIEFDQEQNDLLAKAQLNFNVPEQVLYSKIYETLDPEGGMILGKKASEFLESSGLSRLLLHELWAVADEDGTG